jgi:tetratricopeptide (TPR) repeat protein
MEPTFVMTRYRLGLALEARGLFEEALREFEAMRPSPADPLAYTAIARTQALMGRTDDARRLLGEILEISRTIYVPAATIADVYVALDDHERALDYLALGVEERAIVSMWMHSERHWDPLRSYPRFREFVSRIGL